MSGLRWRCQIPLPILAWDGATAQITSPNGGLRGHEETLTAISVCSNPENIVGGIKNARTDVRIALFLLRMKYSSFKLFISNLGNDHGNYIHNIPSTLMINSITMLERWITVKRFT